MSALVSGYGSSDDESEPVASTSRTLPRLDGALGTSIAGGDAEDEDDEQIEKQARADAFGLQNGAQNGSVVVTKANKEQVTAAPDVLKEVSCLTVIMLTGRTLIALRRQSSLDQQTRS